MSLFVSTTYAQQISFPKLLYTSCEDEYTLLQDRLLEVKAGTIGYEQVLNAEDAYEACHYDEEEQFKHLTEEGNDHIRNKDYADALPLFQDARLLVITTSAVDAVLIDLHIALAQGAYEEGDTNDLLHHLTTAESFDSRDQHDKYLIAYYYSLHAIQQNEWQDAKRKADSALGHAETKEEIDQATSLLSYISERLKAPSSDQFSRRQFWISQLHVDTVRDRIHEDADDIVIAVIDSGIDIYHPDLQGQIWMNEDEIPGNLKDDDNNGYIDDVNGYNFYSETTRVEVSDGHGTLVAGVIGALQNNEIGISGIVPNVKLMSIVACKGDTCVPGKKLSQAIDYAIRNGADIINMSISSSEKGTFNEILNDAIQKANDNNVIVVVAGGNGQEQADGSKAPLDTTQTPISPACNEPLSPKQVIGIGATDNTGKPLQRSNTGKCIDVMAYGEGIVSTAFFSTSTGSYGIAEGTSLATPMVAGIIALGHLIYGEQSRKTVYDALLASTDKNTIPDAEQYIDELAKRRLSKQKLQQVEKVASSIHTLIQDRDPTTQKKQVAQLRRLLKEYETRLMKGKDYQKQSIFYALEHYLHRYDLFQDLY